MTKKILVLGGYGNFGRLICKSLVNRDDIELIIAGRNMEKANNFISSLNTLHINCKLSSIYLDIFSDKFVQVVSDLRPFLVIHTCGPFQGQNYHVPKVCIETGSHYLDLADDRRFVCDFEQLKPLAEKSKSIAITGASSVPGLSSVVIDQYANEFDQIHEIDYAIVPGSDVELGEATLRGILSYVGHAFKGWQDGKLVDLYGWQDIRRSDFGNVLGKRWLANVDIPDLELFPARYNGVKTVNFQAGHELPIVHLSMAWMGWLAKYKFVNRWDKFSSPFYKIGQTLKRLGSDTGGMSIRITGKQQNRTKSLLWKLIAPNGNGPYIPVISTLILARKIIDNDLTSPMATACLGMYNLDEFHEIAKPLGIYQEVKREYG